MSESRFPWRTLLVVSAALNLLAVGAVIGALGAGVRLHRTPPHAEALRFSPGGFVAALPPEARQRMRGELAEGWRESRELRRTAIEARREAYSAAEQEPYDAERVRAALERMRTADGAAIGAFHDRFAETLGQLTPEERRAVLRVLREGRERRMHQRFEGRGPLQQPPRQEQP